MRPQSEIRVSLAAALLDGPGTTRQLAQRTGGSIGLTRMALDNMVRAGDARKGVPIRVPGVRRPVPVYHRAIRQADATAANDAAPLISLIAAWVRPAAVAVA